MQLVIVMGVEAYEAQVNALFEEAQVPVYSRTEIEGYSQADRNAALGGWFAGRSTPAYSVLNFTFVEDKQAASLLERIRHFNEAQQLRNPIRAFRLPVAEWV
jgi:hypothetical protein